MTAAASFVAIACACATASCAATAGSHPPAQALRRPPSSATTSATTPSTARAEPTPGPATAANRAPAELQGPWLEPAAFVRAVLERNPTIEAARHGWRAALARAQRAGSLEDPMLDLALAPLSIGSADAPFGFEASVRQKLPWFGKRSLEAAAGAAEAAAAESDYAAVERELALSSVVLYLRYFVAARALEINAAHVELLLALRDAAAAQVSAGRGSLQDALQAEAELAHLEHDAVLLTSQRDVTIAQMNELLHRAPQLPLPPPSRELMPSSEPDAEVAALHPAATESRPDIAAKEQRARAEQLRSERAEREVYPDLTLSTSYSSMWDLPAQRWMIGLGFNLPFQTGARQGAAEEARALSAQLEQEAAQLRDAARTQVFVTLKQLEESEHILRLFETRLLPLAKRRVEAARAGFSASQNPFMSALEAERSLRDLELDYQKAQAEQLQRRAELARAFGRIPGLDSKAGTP